MLKKDFWYDLPKELIAQEPADPRDSARLMVLSRQNDSIEHKVFRDLPDYLEPGDVLVLNNSKVLPARLIGAKVPTGAVCEVLLLRQVHGDTWECLARPGRRMQAGTRLSFGDGSLTATVDETLPEGNKLVTFAYDTQTLYEKLDAFGKMPLPPYITKQLEDQSQYQTVYAKELGSAAAPHGRAALHARTAGKDPRQRRADRRSHAARRPRHLPPRSARRASRTTTCTANGTVWTKRPPQPSTPPAPPGAASSPWAPRAAARWKPSGQIRPHRALQRQHRYLFVSGVELHAIDALVTNFHLPESTLIMLIAAFYGYDKTMAAYREAVAQRYRFFSFGDAMLIR